ncbi:MAG: GFA family protein [Xanthomonadales bacterium]|nr:GFA family protein [Gammaproteobacteria bacterium]MBT8072961.1 GFA family protein [Gammaproteobacteria bacterium]NNK03802.1 GFA family protein [Xanthomonadales bacterium]
MDTVKRVHGGCFCGAVQFSANLPSKWCAHCHCSMCRKTHGAGYVTWAGFDESQVIVSTGEDKVSWFDSSEEAQRGFCSNCGSSMFFRSQRWAGELHIALGCINDEIDRQPQANVFFDRHVGWMPIDATLKQVDG